MDLLPAQPTDPVFVMHDTPLPEAPSSLQRAMAASARGDTMQALDLLAQAAAEHPDNAIPHFLAGAEHAALGQVEQAELSFARAVLLAPGFPMARYQLGLLQFSAGRVALGLASWQPLLDLGSDSPLPHFVRGFSTLAQDQFAVSRAHFEAGLALVQDNPALADDIQKVLAAMKTSTQAAQPQDEDGDSTGASHVLLANYRGGRMLH